MTNIRDAVTSMGSVLEELEIATLSAERARAGTQMISGRAAHLGAAGLVSRLSNVQDDLGNLLAQIAAITAGAEEIRVQTIAITDGPRR